MNEQEQEQEQKLLGWLVSSCNDNTNNKERWANHGCVECTWAYCLLFATEAERFNRLAERLSQAHIETVVRATAKCLSEMTKEALWLYPSIPACTIPQIKFPTCHEDYNPKSLVPKEFMRALVQKFGTAEDIELGNQVAPPYVHVPIPFSLDDLNPPGPAEMGMTPESAGRSWGLSTDSMFQDYLYDVILSYHYQDIESARKLAAWFKANDIRVWFCEEQVKPGDNIQAKLNDASENTRVTVHCVSANNDGLGIHYTPDSGLKWHWLDRDTPDLQDPAEDVQREICVQLDDTPVTALSRFPCFRWTATIRDDAKLLEICRSKRVPLSPEQLQARERVRLRILNKGTIKGQFTNSMAWSPDELRVLTGVSDGPILLWDVATGRYLRILEGHTGSVDSLIWSSNGQHALSGADDDVVRLWDIATGVCLREFKGHGGTGGSSGGGGVHRVAWSPDERYALSGAADRTIRLWEIATGSCLRVFEGHTGDVHDVAWSADGQRALSGSEDKTIRLWEIASGRCLRTFEGHTKGIRCVAWSPDGGRFLSGSADEKVRLWDVTSGQCLTIFRGHDNDVNGVAWSPDGQRMLSEDIADIRLWDVPSGCCLHVFYSGIAYKRSVRWSPGRLRVLSADLGGSLFWCDLDSLA